jgi:hypothetical protein
MKTYDDLKKKVEENDGVLTVQMLTLREIRGADRLGINVRENIQNDLAGYGLAHFPPRLPDNQYAYARVYKQGTPVADIILAVLDADPAKDAVIRQAAGGNGAEETLRRIKELLDEE